MTTNPLFTVGATVFNEQWKQEKVAKVYKTGRIVLENSTQQYNVDGDMAQSTSGNYRTSWANVRKRIYADTPEHREKRNAAIKLSKARRIISDEYGRLRQIKDDDAIAEAAAIQARSVQP